MEAPLGRAPQSQTDVLAVDPTHPLGGVPGTWNQDPRAQIRNEPGHGVATLAGGSLLPPSQGPETFGIQTPEIDSASGSGRQLMPVWLSFTRPVRWVTALKVPVPIWLSVNDPLPSVPSVTLVWQISNFISTAVDPPMHPSSVRCACWTATDATRFLGSAMAGLLSIIALYQLSIFFRRRDQQESLWFGLLCGVFAVRQAVTTRLPEFFIDAPTALGFICATDLSTPPRSAP